MLTQAALWSTPTPVGTVARDQVCPPSPLTAIAPAPWPLVVGTYPATRHEPPAVHERSTPGRNEEGRSPCCCQLCPKSSLWADHVEMPSLTTTVQSDVPAHSTLVSVSAFMGAVTGDQVVPASRVATTTPLPGSDAPFEPTARQSVGVGHEMPLSCGVLPPATCCAFHPMPPSVVATITSAPAVGGFGPATPTAQHRRAVGHDTAPSSPVPLGAGCPTTSGVPFGSPSTWVVRGELGCPVSAQPDAVAASAARRTVRPPPRRQARRCRGTERGSTAGRQ